MKSLKCSDEWLKNRRSIVGKQNSDFSFFVSVAFSTLVYCFMDVSIFTQHMQSIYKCSQVAHLEAVYYFMRNFQFRRYLFPSDLRIFHAALTTLVCFYFHFCPVERSFQNMYLRNLRVAIKRLNHKLKRSQKYNLTSFLKQLRFEFNICNLIIYASIHKRSFLPLHSSYSKDPGSLFLSLDNCKPGNRSIPDIDKYFQKNYRTPTFDITRLPDVVVRHLFSFLKTSDKVALMFSTQRMFNFCSLRNDMNLDLNGLSSLIPGSLLCPMMDVTIQSESDKCLCGLCTLICPCKKLSYSLIRSELQILFKYAQFLSINLHTDSMFSLFIEKLERFPKNLKFHFTLEFSDMFWLSRINRLDSLSFQLDLSIADYHLFLSFPKVKSLELSFRQQQSFNRFTYRKFIAQILAFQDESFNTLKLNMLPLCINIFEMDFIYWPRKFDWYLRISEIEFNSTELECTCIKKIIANCPKLRRLSLLNITVSDSCRVFHFQPLLRSDRYNFRHKDGRFERVSRYNFLQIISDQELRCPVCVDVELDCTRAQAYQIKFCSNCSFVINYCL